MVEAALASDVEGLKLPGVRGHNLLGLWDPCATRTEKAEHNDQNAGRAAS